MQRRTEPRHLRNIFADTRSVGGLDDAPLLVCEADPGIVIRQTSDLLQPAPHRVRFPGEVERAEQPGRIADFPNAPEGPVIEFVLHLVGEQGQRSADAVFDAANACSADRQGNDARNPERQQRNHKGEHELQAERLRHRKHSWLKEYRETVTMPLYHPLGFDRRTEASDVRAKPLMSAVI